MKRISLYLSNQQIENLRKTAERTGLSVAELIRRAIDEYLEHKHDTGIQDGTKTK